MISLVVAPFHWSLHEVEWSFMITLSANLESNSTFLLEIESINRYIHIYLLLFTDVQNIPCDKIQISTGGNALPRGDLINNLLFGFPNFYKLE